MNMNGGDDQPHDCSVDEFETWCDQLSDLLMECEPSLCDGTSADLSERSIHLDLYGQQVKRLVEDLTLLAQYKASTEAARRAAADPQRMAALRARLDDLNRQEVERRRSDPEFMARLRARVEQFPVLLDRLADS